MPKWPGLPESLPDDIECYSCVGKGWWPIVEQLYESIKFIDPDIHVGQVKEKFGGLRFYYDISRNDDGYFTINDKKVECISRIVGFAENLSLKICERCGSAGRATNDGRWMLTLCDQCAEKSGRTLVPASPAFSTEE